MKEINIQSVSDIITNSSSEVFVIHAPGKTREEVQKWIEDTYQKMQDNDENISYSGMGDDREVFDNTTPYFDGDEEENQPEYPFLPKDYFVIDMDRGLAESLGKKVIEEFKLVDRLEGWLEVDPKTKEIQGFCERRGAHPDLAEVPGGKWVSETCVDYYTNRIKIEEGIVEELANEISADTSKSTAFLKRVQHTLNRLDNAKSEKKAHERFVQYLEKQWNQEIEKKCKKN